MPMHAHKTHPLICLVLLPCFLGASIAPRPEKIERSHNTFLSPQLKIGTGAFKNYASRAFKDLHAPRSSLSYQNKARSENQGKRIKDLQLRILAEFQKQFPGKQSEIWLLKHLLTTAGEIYHDIQFSDHEELILHHVLEAAYQSVLLKADTAEIIAAVIHRMSAQEIHKTRDALQSISAAKTWDTFFDSIRRIKRPSPPYIETLFKDAEKMVAALSRISDFPYHRIQGGNKYRVDNFMRFIFDNLPEREPREDEQKYDDAGAALRFVDERVLRLVFADKLSSLVFCSEKELPNLVQEISEIYGPLAERLLGDYGKHGTHTLRLHDALLNGVYRMENPGLFDALTSALAREWGIEKHLHRSVPDNDPIRRYEFIRDAIGRRLEKYHESLASFLARTGISYVEISTRVKSWHKIIEKGRKRAEDTNTKLLPLSWQDAAGNTQTVNIYRPDLLGLRIIFPDETRLAEFLFRFSDAMKEGEFHWALRQHLDPRPKSPLVIDKAITYITQRKEALKSSSPQPDFIKRFFQKGPPIKQDLLRKHLLIELHGNAALEIQIIADDFHRFVEEDYNPHWKYSVTRMSPVKDPQDFYPLPEPFTPENDFNQGVQRVARHISKDPHSIIFYNAGSLSSPRLRMKRVPREFTIIDVVASLDKLDKMFGGATVLAYPQGKLIPLANSMHAERPAKEPLQSGDIIHIIPAINATANDDALREHARGFTAPRTQVIYDLMEGKRSEDELIAEGRNNLRTALALYGITSLDDSLFKITPFLKQMALKYGLHIDGARKNAHAVPTDSLKELFIALSGLKNLSARQLIEEAKGIGKELAGSWPNISLENLAARLSTPKLNQLYIELGLGLKELTDVEKISQKALRHEPNEYIITVKLGSAIEKQLIKKIKSPAFKSEIVPEGERMRLRLLRGHKGLRIIVTLADPAEVEHITGFLRGYFNAYQPTCDVKYPRIDHEVTVRFPSPVNFTDFMLSLHIYLMALDDTCNLSWTLSEDTNAPHIKLNISRLITRTEIENKVATAARINGFPLPAVQWRESLLKKSILPAAGSAARIEAAI